MARTIAAGRVAFAQSDFFESEVRKQGVVWSDLQLSLFVDGLPFQWAVADGVPISDTSIGAGSVFFNEVSGAVGFYLVRFFPDRTGFWRIVLRHSALGVESILEFDAIPQVPQTSGLIAKFGP